jgi:hypothetical protein
MDNAPALVLGQRGDKSRQGKGKETALTQEDDLTSTTRGFTSSYLRRVPELADMAKRVVKAEAKRRAREDRNRTKGRDQQMGLSMKEDPHSRGASRKEDLRGNLGSKQQGLDPGPKMKRLFGWAIVKLYEEGSIVIWDGPVRHCGEAGCNSASVIWRVNSNTDTSYPDSTVFSSITEPSRLENDSDPGELSDPQSDEEAYIPLSPAYLASHVEKVIGTLMASHSTISGDVLASGRTVSNRAPQPGPTKEQITSCLRRDGRWARVGEWAVDDALEVLQAEGKVWGIGGGRWELCR